MSLARRTLAAALAGALALHAGAPALAQEQKATVVFQDVGPERDAFNEEVVRRFEAEHPDIDVRYNWIANEPYKTGIKVMLESNSPPDVYFVWAGSFSSDFVDSGVAEDVSASRARGDAWTRGATDAITDQFLYQGGLYGVPAEIYTKVFWKNDAFFARHGLEAPRTIGETVRLCRRIRSIDRKVTPISFGGSESWTISHYVTMLFQRHVDRATLDADYQLRSGRDALFTDPGYVAALEDLKRLEAAGCFNKGINSMDPGVSRTMFAIDLAAMTFCGSWCPPVFDADGAGPYSPFPFPAVEGGRGDQRAALVGVQGYQLSAKSKVQDEAMVFLNYLLSPDTQALLARMAGQLPANASALRDGDLPAVSMTLLDLVAEAPSSVPPVNTVLEVSVGDVVLKSGQDFLAGTIDAKGFMDRVRRQALRAKARS